MSRHRAHRGPVRRRALALGGVAAVVAVALGTVVTSAAFTDAAEADLGTVGGSYDIALVDAEGTVVQGDPAPLVLTTVVPGPGGAPAVEVDAVTTTPATGPVVLSLTNARRAPLPADPGVPGPGADPYDVALFTVTVDGTPVVSAVPAAELAPVRIDGWETGVVRTVQVSVTLPDAVGNPYHYGRAMVLGLQLDGSTS
ncbi:hypothetical protein [Cellulomonas hominis]|uniref:hypothetical protein n=1 Tax=Cellulomonas hominis TaxID=156981 RepID=UPI001B93E4AF|nr:hypothetical protein [Cellulomonas hominis]VTR76311.1 hypothetical protein CHMI_01068 [Cellulomonas hominis]